MKYLVYPNWVHQIKTGSVLKWPSGVLRPIRLLHDNRPEWRKTWCFFVIKHCSWTHRCYTLYNIGELVQMKVTYTGIIVHFKDKLSPLIVEAMQDRIMFYKGRKLDCCFVKGLP